MAYEPKVLLTLFKEGGILIRQEKVEKEYTLRKKDLSPNQKWKGDEGNKIVEKGKYFITPLKQNEVSQRIKLCGEAYTYMTSSECPSWYKDIKKWRFKLTPSERLELHLERLCQHHGGYKYTYSIIDD